MARHHRQSWHSRSTQDDQRRNPMSGAAIVVPHGVLLPMHLRIQDAEDVTIDLARTTVPGGPPVAALPLPPSMGSIKAKNGSFVQRAGGGTAKPRTLSLIPYHNLCIVNLHTFLTIIQREPHTHGVDAMVLFHCTGKHYWSILHFTDQYSVAKEEPEP